MVAMVSIRMGYMIGHGLSLISLLTVACGLGLCVVHRYRMFGMDASENVLYRSKCFQPTYQWIAMMEMIIIDAQYESRIETFTKNYNF